MAKSNGQNVILLVVIVAVVAFGVGFVAARAKYKPQLAVTYGMVMDRESTITKLQAQVKNLEKQIATLNKK